MSKEEIEKEDMKSLKKGMHNLLKHVDNLKNKFGMQVIVAINKYNHDSDKEINYLQEVLGKENIEMSLVESWGKGSSGAIDLANKVISLSDKQNDFKYAYELEDTIKEKIEKVCKNIYGANSVDFSKNAEESIEMIEKLGYDKLPICIAKTQYSFSDDQKNLECEEPFSIHINEVVLKVGAEFIVAMAGNIMTMPGLPKIPAAENMKINEKGEITGIF